MHLSANEASQKLCCLNISAAGKPWTSPHPPSISAFPSPEKEKKIPVHKVTWCCSRFSCAEFPNKDTLKELRQAEARDGAVRAG